MVHLRNENSNFDKKKIHWLFVICSVVFLGHVYVSQEFSFNDQGVITNTCKTELIAIEYRKSGYLKIVCTHSFYYCCYNFRSTGNHNQLLAAIGTTVEIFSMKEENEAGICTLRIKATGRQRFRIKELRRQVDGSVS